MRHPGQKLREELANDAVIEPFLGVYDCLSASAAAQYSANLLLSGFGFAAGYYGLPDAGYACWNDLVATAWRIRQILPEHRLLVDVDAACGDTQVARLVARQLESMGAAMVVVSDQPQPGLPVSEHSNGLLSLSAFIEKIIAVLDQRDAICVLAKTYARGDEARRRVEAISATGVDALLVDGIDNLDALARVRAYTDRPLAFNQPERQKESAPSLDQLRAMGVRLVQYANPLLVAAQQAMTASLDTLIESGGILPFVLDVTECRALLQANLLSRNCTVMAK